VKKEGARLAATLEVSLFVHQYINAQQKKERIEKKTEKHFNFQ
jgi:hypothetical protein